MHSAIQGEMICIENNKSYLVVKIMYQIRNVIFTSMMILNLFNNIGINMIDQFSVIRSFVTEICCSAPGTTIC